MAINIVYTMISHLVPDEAPPLTARTSMNLQAENSPEIMAFKIHRDVVGC